MLKKSKMYMMDICKEDWQTCEKFLARKFIVSLEHLPFIILTFYLLDVFCPIQENITVYKVSLKNFDSDFYRPKCNWINQVLGF